MAESTRTRMGKCREATENARRAIKLENKSTGSEGTSTKRMSRCPHRIQPADRRHPPQICFLPPLFGKGGETPKTAKLCTATYIAHIRLGQTTTPSAGLHRSGPAVVVEEALHVPQSL